MYRIETKTGEIIKGNLTAKEAIKEYQIFYDTPLILNRIIFAKNNKICEVGFDGSWFIEPLELAI